MAEEDGDVSALRDSLLFEREFSLSRAARTAKQRVTLNTRWHDRVGIICNSFLRTAPVSQ